MNTMGGLDLPFPDRSGMSLAGLNLTMVTAYRDLSVRMIVLHA